MKTFPMWSVVVLGILHGGVVKCEDVDVVITSREARRFLNLLGFLTKESHNDGINSLFRLNFGLGNGAEKMYSRPVGFVPIYMNGHGNGGFAGFGNGAAFGNGGFGGAGFGGSFGGGGYGGFSTGYPIQPFFMPAVFQDEMTSVTEGGILSDELPVTTTTETAALNISSQDRVKRNRYPLNRFLLRQAIESDEVNETDATTTTETATEVNTEVISTTVATATTTQYPPINQLPLQDEPFRFTTIPPLNTHQEPPIYRDPPQEFGKPQQDEPIGGNGIQQPSHHPPNYPHHESPYNYLPPQNNHQPQHDEFYQEPPTNFLHDGYPQHQNTIYSDNNYYEPSHHEPFYPTPLPLQQQHYPPQTITIRPGQYGHSQNKDVDRTSFTTEHPLATTRVYQPRPQSFKPSIPDMSSFFRPSVLQRPHHGNSV